MARLSSKEMLKRLTKAKEIIDRGLVTSISKVAMQTMLDNRFGSALVDMGAVHKDGEGIYRWNGLALTIKNANTLYDKYIERKKTSKKKFKRRSSKPDSLTDAIGEETINKISKILQNGSSPNKEMLDAISKTQLDIRRIKEKIFDIESALGDLVKNGAAIIIKEQFTE